MQDDRSEVSIISAFERIYKNLYYFDDVAIIHGGGATSELSSFDWSLLAASCAQFPLPIITGIGHERDETVLDIVAHTRAKTPTAVAELLIDKMTEAWEELMYTAQSIISITNIRMQDESAKLSTYQAQATFHLKGWYKEQGNILASIKANLSKGVQQILKDNKNRLDSHNKHLELISPENVLKKGYSLTTMNGKIIKKTDEVKQGDEITTLLSDGEIKSIVK